jgi:uncharacterized protein DUF6459
MTSTADASMREEHVGKARQTARNINVLRRLPSCDSQPPFDDELALAGDGAARPLGVLHARDHGQRALSLAFALPGGLPVVPSLPDSLREKSDRGTPELRLVPALPQPLMAPLTERITETPKRRPVRDVTDEDDAPQPTPRDQLPEPVPWAGRLVQGILEVLSGVRPLSQLVRWTTTEVYDSIATRTEHRSRRISETREIAPHRLAEVVRSVHVSEPVDGIAEVCAIVQQGPRCRAVALRLEGIDGRWQCTALQIG